MFDKSVTLSNIIRSNCCVSPHLYPLRLLYLYAPSPEVVAFVVVSTADVSEPQASVGIPVVFDFLIPVFVVALVDLDSSGHPKFFAFPNVDLFASSSSSVEVVGQESGRNSIDVHAIYDLYSILSNLGLHQNRILEYRHNNPSLGHNTVSDTSVLPMDATTSHSRKTNQRLCQGQRKHRSYQGPLSPPEVPQM
jgi:hypothetical protein